MKEKEKVTYEILLKFGDREIANHVFAALKQNQVGYTIETKTEKEPLYPILRVAFDKTNRRYTYRATEEIAEEMERDEKKRKGNYPTRYGSTYGESEPVQRLTKKEADKLYPFDQMIVVNKPIWD